MMSLKMWKGEFLWRPFRGLRDSMHLISISISVIMDWIFVCCWSAMFYDLLLNLLNRLKLPCWKLKLDTALLDIKGSPNHWERACKRCTETTTFNANKVLLDTYCVYLCVVLSINREESPEYMAKFNSSEMSAGCFVAAWSMCAKISTGIDTSLIYNMYKCYCYSLVNSYNNLFSFWFVSSNIIFGVQIWSISSSDSKVSDPFLTCWNFRRWSVHCIVISNFGLKALL